MKLGLIVLPSSNEEMQTVLEALNEAGVGYLAAAGIDAAAEGKPAKKAGKKAAKQPESEEEDEDEDIDDFEDEEAEQETLKVPTGPELKKAFTDLRDSEGADVCKEILTSFGAKGLKDLDKDDWAAAYAACLEAAKGDADSDEDDDGFDDFEDDADEVDAPDAETVKTACQAWAQKAGKEKPTAALKKNGLNTVRGLKAASDEQLAGIYKMVPAEFK